MSRARRFIRTIQAQQSKKELCLVVGSSQTVVSIGEKIVYNQATCLALHRSTNEVIATGDKAYQLLGKTGPQVSVVFPVINGVVASSRYFRLFLQAIQSEVGVTSALIPFLVQQKILVAGSDTFSPVEQHTFEKDITQMQWGKPVLVSKALAIANGLERLQGSNTQLCVITIGGMATEIAVIGGGEVIASQRFLLGGVDFTEAVQNVIRADQQCAVSWHVAEAVKQSIGFVEAEIVPRTIRQKKMSIQGKNISSQLGKTVVIEAAGFSPAFTILTEELLLNIQSFFSLLPTDLSTGVLSAGIVLSGGAARMQGMADCLSEQLHAEVTVSSEPELDVIKGMMKMYERQSQ